MLVDMLTQWVSHCQAGDALASTLEEYADKIWEVADGHMGISGYALMHLPVEVDTAHEEHRKFTAEDFETYLAWRFPDQLISVPVYYRMIQDAKHLSDQEAVIFAKVQYSEMQLLFQVA